MTDRDSDWIEVPGFLQIQELAEITVTFKAVGIEHQHRTITTGVSRNGPSFSAEHGNLGGVPVEQHAYSLYVLRDHVHGAAMILRAYFEMHDPAMDQPFSGCCPACAETLLEAWACTSCELLFRTPEDPDDLLLPFLREHGGFDEP